MLKKILLVSLSVVLLLVLAASGGSYYMVHRALPTIEGEIITSVDKPVRIVRDQYGVPHLYAETEKDLFFAQGYVQAQDRMFQLELSRRNIGGNLAEIMGEKMIKLDHFNRTIGFRRAAEEGMSKVNPETMKALQAFADGVNAYLEDHADSLPVEYTMLGFKPEPWTPLDSLSIGKYMAWELGTNMRTELFMGVALPKLDEDKLLSLLYQYDQVHPTIVKQSEMEKAIEVSEEERPKVALSKETVDSILVALDLADQKALPGEGLGSNNWVISGKKTESGKPLLANDMHLGLSAPSTFYQNHLVLPGKYNVTGAIFPGVPGVIVGHNDKVAWGFTNLAPDVQDLFIEKPNPANPHQFEYDGKWYDAKVIQEEIKVKGQAEPVKAEIVISRHGPIITNMLDSYVSKDQEPAQTIRTAEEVTQPLALRWTAHDTTDEITAMLGFDKANNYKEFEAAMKLFQAPAQNVVYADVEGNIAYHAMGSVPIRAKGDGLSPVPGWTSEYEWTGYIAWDELPHAINPEKGYFASANNKPVDGDYPYHLSYDYDLPYRATRIGQMIEEKDKLNLEDMERMQTDWLNLQAKQHGPVFISALQAADLTETEQKAFEVLKAWLSNPLDEPDLAGPVVYHAMYIKMYTRFFEPHLTEEFFYHFNRTAMPNYGLEVILRDSNPKWFQGTDDSKEKAIVDSFKQAVAWMAEEHGKNPDKWKWGKVHTFSLSHPLGSIKPLNLLYNIGPYEYGGSNGTVGMAGFSRGKPFNIVLGAPWRFVVDMNDVNGAKDALTMGASAQLGSDHYQDQTEMWLEGRYKTMHFTSADVEANGERTLILQPE
ncbi:hypothetical protein CIG75_06690 [Tumebacillus algifaecis]|uniref:Penicillin acylase family protein n=1 Tax=Tumebacillus algifaecis TaxID=1214604 RepID=A0A223CZA3_9BACL|nr:penicillin acylase family protein [Tumebacillus algifaecis]ASS74690.1 hypothetical protein CIG75_06690 [Tumebacillus algifaecis]